MWRIQVCWCRKHLRDKETESHIRWYLQVEGYISISWITMGSRQLATTGGATPAILTDVHTMMHSKCRSIQTRAPTITCCSIPTVSCVASTCEGSKCVGAESVHMTRRLSHTFIDVCRWKHRVSIVEDRINAPDDAITAMLDLQFTIQYIPPIYMAI